MGDALPLLLLGAKGEPVRVNLRVVGIDAAPAEFPPQYGPGVDYIWATPAFVRAYGARLLDTPGVAVRLRHGAADVPALEREINRMGGGKFVNDYPLGPQAANTEHSIHLQAVALWLLAGVLAVLGLLILGQLHARLTGADQADSGTLRALGVVPRQLAAAGLARAALIGGAGAVLAVATAVAISPVFPVGLAGIAEPYPGIDADWTALLLGAGGVLVATVGVAASAGLAGGAGQGRRGGRAAGREDVRRPAVRGAGRHAFRAVGPGRDGGPVRAAAGRRPNRRAGAVRDRRHRRRGCRAERGARVQREPRVLAGDAAAVRGGLGRARHQRAVRHVHRARGAQHRRRPAHSGLVRDVRWRSADGQRDRGRRGDHRARS